MSPARSFAGRSAARPMAGNQPAEAWPRNAAVNRHFTRGVRVRVPDPSLARGRTGGEPFPIGAETGGIQVGAVFSGVAEGGQRFSPIIQAPDVCVRSADGDEPLPIEVK